MKIGKWILLMGFLLCTGIDARAQIDRVEPMNWWVGMKDPGLQLMVHGDGVGETVPSLSYPGVRIKGYRSGDSRNYLFIDLEIGGKTAPGEVVIGFKKGGRLAYEHRYALKRREGDGTQLKGFDPSDVIYLIVPDRFANGDPRNDSVAGMRETSVNRAFPGGRHGGDIRGIINSLDYLRQMGFTAIWPTPLLENDMPAYSYHGYAITDHYKVDPRFGTLDDYKELSATMRRKGMKLIFDEVLNHTGSNYWWMKDLPFKDWLNHPDRYTPTNHRRTVNQDIHASQYDKDLWSKGWFDKTMPDMNGRNPFMAKYLIQCTIWWIETLQLGGVRQDTYGYSDKGLLKDWSCAIMKEYPNFSIVGEEWSTNPLITAYWQQGKVNHDGYAGCLNTVMDFPLQSALVRSLNKEEGETYHTPFTALYEALANDFVYADPDRILVMGDNHDMDRLFMQLKQDPALQKMALGYLLTIRGIPQIFYGTEILMDNSPNHKNDGLIRSDFPGGWKGDVVNGFTGTGLTADQLSMQEYLRRLLTWRKASRVVARGRTLHFAPFDGVYVFFRYDAERTVMVVMNRNEKELTIDAGRFSEILKGKRTAKDIITDRTIDLTAGIPVAPKTTAIFEVD